MINSGWENKISNTAQLGGIETAILDNGMARGTRIAWINTGSGLRYKVVIDRGMDIADAFYNEYSLTWLSHLGITSPERFSDRGTNWLKTFGGGLLTTCGLTHTGGPEGDELGLHGPYSNLRAEIESIKQPDPLTGNMQMSITGIVRETKIFGPSLELKRTISGELGKPAIRIHDQIINRGNQPAPHMLLYHCNLGWPLADEGAEIIWQGEWQARDEESKSIFQQGINFHRCPSPMESHLGSGEAAAFIDINSDQEGKCVCGLYNGKIQLGLAIKFYKNQLPWLINWQHWAKGEYITGLEPATHPPIGQSATQKNGTLIFIQPGEYRNYDVEMKVMKNHWTT